MVAGTVPYMARPGYVLPEAGPEQQRMVRTLENEGIPITPAQRANSPFGRVFESVLKYLPTSATRSAAIDDEQMRNWTRSIARHMGATADTFDPATLSQVRQDFRQGYNALEAQTPRMGPDRPFVSELSANHARYVKGFPAAVKNEYVRYLNDVVAYIQGGAGPNGLRIDGVEYHALQSQLAEEARAALRSTEPTTRSYGQAMRGLSSAFENLMERNAGPGLADQWRDINRRYAVFSIIEDTMARAGNEKLRTGFIPPQTLATEMRTRDPRGWVEERSPFTELARAGAAILPDPVPNSGTSQRSFAQDLATGFSKSWPTAAGAGAVGAAGVGTVGAGAAALAGPYAASRLWYGRQYSMPEAAMIGASAVQGASEEGLLGPRDTFWKKNGPRR
jgi:hypothetical protein